MKPLLWRLRHSPWFIAAAVLVLTSGAIVGGTFASFTADTQQNTSTFAGGFVGAATGLSVTPSGYDAQLAWTPGTHGPVTGQTLNFLDNGSSSSCPTTGYSLVANMASAGTSSYTASNPATTTIAASHNIETPNLLNAGINNAVTAIVMKNNASFAFTSNFVIQIDSEQMLVTAQGGAGNKNWTVQRGYNGTTAASHLANAAVTQISVNVTSASGFPGTNGYTINIDSENMTVNSGAGTTTWLVTRGANSTTKASHASGAMVTQVPDPVDGHYYCYQMVSTSATNWTATASFPATQMGLVATSITLANGGSGTSGHVDTGDTITIVFNQAPTGITTGSGTRDVCVVDTASPAAIVLNDSAGCHGSTDANDAGVISGLTLSGGGMGGANAIVNCNTSTVSLTGSTLTITVGGAGACAAGSGTPVSSSGSGTYTPASSILSSAVTDQAPVCTSATYGCLPTTTGNF